MGGLAHLLGVEEIWGFIVEKTMPYDLGCRVFCLA